MKKHCPATKLVTAVVLSVVVPLFVGSIGFAQSTETTEPSDESTIDPLAPFERFVGGRWHLEDSFQELEWGPGRQSVKARGFFVVESEPTLVSEGMWFWHPGEQAIKGYVTAIDMPVVFFDYTTRFEGDTMLSDLVAYDAQGDATAYQETWELTDQSHFIWKLMAVTPEGPTEVMGATYERQVSAEADSR